VLLLSLALLTCAVLLGDETGKLDLLPACASSPATA
jgi:hypothetical protein